ncbi:hypothetical protein RRSWK_01657 [Rhodopirellula sp. SWK7]|nr:hypothetical protein RRSWK_01657 [Rhodopirellula sp. SWK7]
MRGGKRLHITNFVVLSVWAKNVARHASLKDSEPERLNCPSRY